jgi:hypothetical protein
VTSAFPAATIMAHISLAEKRESISALQDMTTSERALARNLLEQVPTTARIDPGALVRDVRERIVAQAEARQSDAPAWKYALELMSDDQLAAFRERVADGTDPDAAAREAMASPAPPASPWTSGDLRCSYDDDEEPDDEDVSAQPRRRSIPRYRPPRALRESSQSVSGPGVVDASGERDTAPSAARRRSRVMPRVEPFALGGIAAFADGYRIGPAPGYVPLRPPWLLDDGDDGETDDVEPDNEEETAA